MDFLLSGVATAMGAHHPTTSSSSSQRSVLRSRLRGGRESRRRRTTTTTTTTTASAMIQQPVASYRFPCTIDSKPSIEVLGTPSSSSFGDLVAINDDGSNNNNYNNTEATATTETPPLDSFLTCPYVQFADGVTSTLPLESTKTVADLQPYFHNAEALVVEAWITPVFVSAETEELAKNNINNNKSIPIISVATPLEGSDGTSSQSDCDGIQFSISQLGNRLEIRYKDFYDYLLEADDDDYVGDTVEVFGCRHLIVPDKNDDDNTALLYQNLNHIVVAWSQAGASFQVYANGVKAVDFNLLGPQPATLPYDLQSWDPTYTLQMFTNAMSSTMFPGLIHKVSLYKQLLLPDDVLTMYQEGLEDRKQEYIFEASHPLHLIASAWNTSLIQGDYAILGLGGDYNVSTPFWNIMAEIQSIPQYGDLMTQDSIKVLKIGERLPVDGGLSRVKMVYQQTREDFFSIPKFSYDGSMLPHGEESFDYRLIAVNVDDPQQVFGWSDPVHQVLEIIHKNHPPKLEISEEVVRPPGGQPKEAFKRPFATLGAAVLRDELDYDINRVRVDVWARNGSLSILSDEVRELADFESCTKRSATSLSSSDYWQCHGDGLKDTNMTFLATPGDASVILSNIQYNAFHWNQSDVITLRIFDGAGGSCLSEEEHLLGRFQTNKTSTDYRYETVHSECFEIEKLIKVPSFRSPSENRMNGLHGYLYRVFIDLKDWSWADAVSWGFFLLLFYFLYRMVRCCSRCCGRCLRRRNTAAIHVDPPPATSTRTLDCLDIEDELEPPTDANSVES